MDEREAVTMGIGFQLSAGSKRGMRTRTGRLHYRVPVYWGILPLAKSGVTAVTVPAHNAEGPTNSINMNMASKLRNVWRGT